jgi:PAS domain S-box-containing protein
MKPRPSSSPQALRAAAEARVQADVEPPRSPDELLRIQHELRVHQIELEMQNEELLEARAEIEAGLGRYTDLYDFAPSGYFNLDPNSVIHMANLAGAHLAGRPRAELVGLRFGLLLDISCREAFANLLEKVFATGETQALEATLLPRDQAPRIVQLAASLSPDAAECRLAVLDITEARQARQALDLRERALAEVSNGVLITDEKRRIIYANKGFVELTGYPEAEVLGRNCSFLQGPGTSQETILKMRAALDAEQPFEGEILNYRKDGAPFWNELTIAPIVDPAGGPSRFVGIQRDVTERKRTTALLADSQRRLALATEAARIGIWEWDATGDAMICNQQMLKLHGLDRPDLLIPRAAWLATIHPDDCPRVEAEIAAALQSGRDFQSQFRIRLPDGRIRHLQSHGAVHRRGDSARTHMIGVSWDVTEECESREKIAAALAHEKQLATEARAGELAKREFLAVMSHEVRTPVNGILGFAELLAQAEDLPLELHNYSRIIAQSTESLLRILDDILEFSRLEAGQTPVETAPLSPRKLLGDIRDLFLTQTADKGLELDISVAPDVPEYLAGDAGRLRQILLNLVGNSMKFTTRGHITIGLSRAADSSSDFVFSVRDTGPGIPADQLEKIFQPFAQADSSTSRRHGGTGLGLAIARRLAELLGGTLRVTSEPGHGSEFVAIIPLPVAASPLAPAPAVPPHALDASFAARHPMKILLVEDDPINRKLIGVLVRRLGYEPLIAKNGKEAVEVARDHHPDCILMDIQMPEMDGIEATRAIRRFENGSHAYISALTAHILPSDRQRCFDAGMDDYLNKPIKIAALAEVLAKVSESKHRPGASE